MDKMRRQVLRQIASLATLTGAAVAGSSCADTVFAASDSDAGPLTVADLGKHRRGRTGAQPKIVRTPAQLMADKLVMPYERANVVKGGRLPYYSYKLGTYSGVGLTQHMGAAGERQEIGVETDAIADWLMGGSPHNMLVQAEAHGSVPVHFLHEGMIVDAIKYPRATCDPRGWSRGQRPFFDASGTPVEPEQAHYPSLSYIPYLATGDTYYLEELQFAATFMIINAPPDYRGYGKARINDIQHRGLAWGLREVAKAYVATPDGAVPAPLLPKSYWKRVLDNIRADMTAKWVESRNPFTQNAHMHPSTEPFNGCIAPWQHDFISQVLGWMIYTGRFPEWKPLYEFQVRQAIIRATGPLRSQAIGYELKSIGAADWPSLLKLNDKGTPTGSGHFPSIVRTSYPHYAGLLRASLSLAVKNGVTGAKEAYDYAHAEARRVGLISLRHAV